MSCDFIPPDGSPVSDNCEDFNVTTCSGNGWLGACKGGSDLRQSILQVGTTKIQNNGTIESEQTLSIEETRGTEESQSD